MEHTTVANNVKRLRIERGWTQVDLAERAVLANSSVRGIELNKNSPQLSTLINISRALGVPIQELFV